MSTAEIIEELSLLSTSDRAQISAELVRLNELEWDHTDELALDEKKLILSRIREADQHPESLIPWHQAKVELQTLAHQ